MIGLESTSLYAETLIGHMLSKGSILAVINPIQTSTLRKANIRNTKTASIDALLVVKSLIFNGWPLYNLLRKASHGHYGKETARRLKSLAKSSVGIRVIHKMTKDNITFNLD